MAKIIIRFWESKLIAGSERPHVSLQTPRRYFSFYPQQREDSSGISPGKFGELKEAEQDKPSTQLTLDLDDKAIDCAIEEIFKENPTWQSQQVKSNYSSLNCATAVLLLLKIGGVASNLQQIKIKKEYGENINRALFNLHLSSAVSSFFHFSAVCNRDISPQLVLNIARASIKKYYFWINLYTGISFAASFAMTAFLTQNQIYGSTKRDAYTVGELGFGLAFCVMSIKVLQDKFNNDKYSNFKRVGVSALLGALTGTSSVYAVSFFRLLTPPPPPPPSPKPVEPTAEPSVEPSVEPGDTAPKESPSADIGYDSDEMGIIHTFP